MFCKASLSSVAALSMLGSGSVAAAQSADRGDPTCSDLAFLDIDVHGQHVVRDYVAGDHDVAAGRDLGQRVGANQGAAVPGGPGAGGHLPAGIAPGASFCTDSQSPGVHLGG